MTEGHHARARSGRAHPTTTLACRRISIRSCSPTADSGRATARQGHPRTARARADLQMRLPQASHWL